MVEEDKGTTRAPDESEGTWVEDISDTVAPSVGPHSTVVRRPHPEHDAQDVDAMGQDKRRQVVGHSYGPSFARQATLYLVFVLVAVAIAVGVKLLVDKYDQPPKHFAAEAPWAQPGVRQIPTKPLQ
jgi:hypothetical protein